MSIDEYIKREEALRDAKKHLLGGIDENLRQIALSDMPIGMQPNLPPMPPTPRFLTQKGYSVSQLKSMTEDELLAEDLRYCKSNRRTNDYSGTDN